MSDEARDAGGFSPDWLSLREPLDAASRDAALGTTLAGLLAASASRDSHQPDSRLRIIDLGAGTGSNLRYMAPLLGGAQDWLLVEHDPVLRAAQAGCMRAWAGSSGLQAVAADALAMASGTLPPAGEALVLSGPQFDCRLRGAALDLATQLEDLPLTTGALVCASALLDLVSESWLRALAGRAEKAAVPVWFALTYDGRIECEPAEPEDPRVRQLFNTHQRTDKGFGLALGPDAAWMADQVFTEHGYRTWSRRSDWNIGPGQRELQQALVDGWFEAASQIAGPDPALRDWLRRRLAHIETGRSRLLVGHVDLAGWPAG